MNITLTQCCQLLLLSQYVHTYIVSVATVTVLSVVATVTVLSMSLPLITALSVVTNTNQYCYSIVNVVINVAAVSVYIADTLMLLPSLYSAI